MMQIQVQTKPAINEFLYFIEEYFSRCIKGFEPLDVLTAKWTFEDLIPGLSDVDTRLVVDNCTGPEEFVELDEMVGKVHLNLCREYPRWARILEHTPGIAITWNELYDSRLYNPETRSWSAYLGKVEEFAKYETYLASLPWRDVDEYFFLNKFAYYFSPYQRGIDPAINLGIFEPEYAWHSRAMHYFTPAAQAGLSIIKRKAIRGKFETLRLWKEILPRETIFDEILEMGKNQYVLPYIEEDAILKDFEDRLFGVLCKIKQLILDATTIFHVEPDENIKSLRAKLKAYPVDLLKTIFYGIRFSRIRKGRYLFYLRAPEFFATDWLIENEFVKWNREVLVKAILNSYGRLKCGKPDVNLEEIIEAISPVLIDAHQANILRRVQEISFDRYQPGMERQLIEEIIPLWRDYYLILERILKDAKNIAPLERVENTSLV